MTTRTKFAFYLYRFLSDFTPIYALYPLLFKSQGLSESWISLLFMVLALSTLAFELPTGIVADRLDRRLVLALSGFAKALGFFVWLIWPDLPGFMLGLILWGLGTSFESGCWQAFIYDELASERREHEFRSLLARMLGTSFSATLVSSLLGSVLFHFFHNYSVVLLVSIVALMCAGIVPVLFKKAALREQASSPSIRAHLVEAIGIWRRSPSARWIILSAALLGGIKASLDEYHGLLLSSKLVQTSMIPLFYAGFTLMGAIVFFSLSRKHKQTNANELTRLLGGIGILILSVALLPTWFAVVMLFVMNVLDSIFRVDNEALLQSAIDSDATRATITSASSFSQQLVSLCVFGASSLAVKFLPLTWLYIIGGIILIVTALYQGRRQVKALHVNG